MSVWDSIQKSYAGWNDLGRIAFSGALVFVPLMIFQSLGLKQSTFVAALIFAGVLILGVGNRNLAKAGQDIGIRVREVTQ